MDKLHIITLNTQGLREKEKRNRLNIWINQQNVDIILLQETHFTKELEKFLRAEWKGDIIHSFGTSQSCGVSTLIHEKFNYEILNIHKDEFGRF